MTSSSENTIKNTSWFQAKELQQLFAALLEKGDEVKIVGGAPRNHLLGKQVEDVDLATIYTPQEVIAKAKRAGIKYSPTGIEHGTVTLIINKTSFEITSLREDVKTDGRRAVVKFAKDWLQDAKRRDFTINALYVTAEGRIEDPLKQGLADINTKTVKFIGNAEDRIKEDYLRSLRFYRFTSYYSHPPFDPAALSATINLRHGLRTLSAQRVKAELFKILKAPDPKPVIKELYQNGLLTLLSGTAPNISALYKLLELEEALAQTANAALRLAVLAAWQNGDAERLKERFRLSRNETEQVELRAKASLEKASLAESINPGSTKDNFEKNKYLHYLGIENYITLLKILYALGDNPLEKNDLVRELKKLQLEPQIKFPVKGADLIAKGYKQGPNLGAILEKLETKWLKSNRLMSREELLHEVIKID